LLVHFIKQITDPAETERAWERYRGISDFAETARCRHRQICLHFGETPKWKSCGACDVCGSQPEWMAVPVHTAPRVARRRLPVTIPDEPMMIPLTQSSAQPDSALREYVREWRRMVAKRQSVPAYIIMHDTSLEELCRIRPRSLAALGQVTGFGERKIEAYGEQILSALEEFEKGARAAQPQEQKTKPAEETLRLLKEGKSFEEIAGLRQRQIGTVIATVATLVEQGEVAFDDSWVEANRRSVIEAACRRLGTQWLKPLKEALPPEITFEEIRLVVARWRRQEAMAKESASA
jgi:ATP-dependent DNA helicase RecQ